MTFNGSKLRALREAKLWTRLALAKRLNVSSPQIGRWESGAATPRGEMIKKLGRVLGVAVSELIDIEETKETVNA
jgi:transcriptional regulator with XRE-family HTH domain